VQWRSDEDARSSRHYPAKPAGRWPAARLLPGETP